MGRAAAFFDLDKTIIATSSTLAFGRPFRHNGLINRRVAFQGACARMVYLLMGADESRMDRMRDYVATLCAGWDVATVSGIVREALHEIVDPLVYAEATALIDQHRAAGRDVIIVSSSGEEVVGPIGEMLGVDRVIATRMVTKDGRYTGEVAFYAYGENKARAVRALAARSGYDLTSCYAYSDSATDLPLLDAVGHPTAVNPDRTLRRLATERGWPVLLFERPVSARPGVGQPGAGSFRTSLPSLALTGIGVGAAVAGAAVAGGTVAGLAWYAHRRCRSRAGALPVPPPVTLR